MQKTFPAIRELNLPKIPRELIENLNYDFSSYDPLWDGGGVFENKPVYRLTESHSEELNKWCKANICANIDWGFQIIIKDSFIHQDHRPYGEGIVESFPRIKFVYQILTGGDNVKTEIYNKTDQDDYTLQETYIFEPSTWYLFDVERYHRVVGIEQGKTRFAIVGHIF